MYYSDNTYGDMFRLFVIYLQSTMYDRPVVMSKMYHGPRLERLKANSFLEKDVSKAYTSIKTAIEEGKSVALELIVDKPHPCEIREHLVYITDENAKNGGEGVLVRWKLKKRLFDIVNAAIEKDPRAAART